MNQETGKSLEVSRRSFLSVAALAGASAAFAMTGCSPATSGSKDKAEADQAKPDVVNTYDADLVVVGGGISGLACAVQGALDGLDVIIIEKSNATGGNGVGVEGMFAINSNLQKERGIQIEASDILTNEMEEAQYAGDYSLWLDLAENSADNIAWCQEQGVEYSGLVDNYSGTGLYPTMHWFKNGHCSEGYTPQMTARANELGVTTLLNTEATQLIEENGAIVGVYAKAKEGYIQINDKAVVLATGGAGSNRDLQYRQGWSAKASEEITLGGIPTVTGDGWTMAAAVGARDFLPHASQLTANFIPAFGIDGSAPYDDPLTTPSGGIAAGGPLLWVNQDANRFTAEDLFTKNFMLQSVPLKNNRVTYAIFDQNLIESYTSISTESEKTLANGLKENTGNSLFSANSLDELAGFVDLDEKQLKATIERYNELCEQGADLDFGKNAAFMQPITKAPFYIARLDCSTIVTIGGITTNIRHEVLDDNLDAIPGLYAVGVDGCMLYYNVYTINIPGTCCGNNVNSGRSAAKAAKKYIES